jgi:hypothetical protein
MRKENTFARRLAMKVVRLLLIALAVLLLATACDSRDLMEALLGPGGGPSPPLPTEPPAIVTATLPVLVVTATPPPIVATATPSSDAVVSASELNLRRGPSTVFAPPLEVLRRGDPLTVIGRNGYFSGRQLWLKVIPPSGREGWVAGWLVTLYIDINSVPVVATPVPPPPTATPTPSEPSINFWADSTYFAPGGCTTLHWDVENAQAVLFEGMGVSGHETRDVCPPTTTTYTLTIIKLSGETVYSTVTITVSTEPFINFRADRYNIGPSECTTIRWDVEGASAVYFQGIGVVGHSEALVCPGVTTAYSLDVIGADGVTHYLRALTINVDPAYGP